MHSNFFFYYYSQDIYLINIIRLTPKPLFLIFFQLGICWEFLLHWTEWVSGAHRGTFSQQRYLVW